MAEVLIYGNVHFSQVDCIVVYNEWVKNQVDKILKEAGVKDVRVIYPFELVGFNYNFQESILFWPKRSTENGASNIDLQIGRR